MPEFTGRPAFKNVIIRMHSKKGRQMDSNQLFKYVYANIPWFEPIIPGSLRLVLMSPVDSYLPCFRVSRSTENERPWLKWDLQAPSAIYQVLLIQLESKTQLIGAVLGNNDSSVKKALDYAFKLAMNGKQVNVAQDQYFYIPPDDVEEKYKAQPIKPRKNLQKQADPDIPDKIRQMLKLYDYSLLPQKSRAKNFYASTFYGGLWG